MENQPMHIENVETSLVKSERSRTILVLIERWRTILFIVEDGEPPWCKLEDRKWWDLLQISINYLGSAPASFHKSTCTVGCHPDEKSQKIAWRGLGWILFPSSISPSPSLVSACTSGPSLFLSPKHTCAEELDQDENSQEISWGGFGWILSPFSISLSLSSVSASTSGCLFFYLPS